MARTRSTEKLRAMDRKVCEVCGREIRRKRTCSRRDFAKVRFCSQACNGAWRRGRTMAEVVLSPEDRRERRDRDAELQRALERELGLWQGPVCPHCTVGKGQVVVKGLDGREEVWCVACARYAPSRRGMVLVAMSVATWKGMVA